MFEDPSSRRYQVYRATFELQIKMEKLNWKKYIFTSENNLNFNWEKYTGYLAVNHNEKLKTKNKLLLLSCYCRRQFSNLFGSIVFDSWDRLPIRI